MTRVMLDLETFGTVPGSVIKAIGAVKFSPEGLGEEFYLRVDSKSCVAVGMVIDPETVEWWLKQPDDARREMTLPGSDITFALTCLATWLNDADVEIWGNGPSFDCTLLAVAYHLTKLPMPWGHRAERCYRTLRALHPERAFLPPAPPHHALHDARAQAEHARKLLWPVRPEGVPPEAAHACVASYNIYCPKD